MPKFTRDNLMFRYIAQFGLPLSHGQGYLHRILRRYEAHGFSAETADYKLLIAEAAAEKGIKPQSMKNSITRYLKKGWECGFSDTWRYFTGWDGESLPKVNTAIRLICENFDDYTKRYPDG